MWKCKIFGHRTTSKFVNLLNKLKDEGLNPIDTDRYAKALDKGFIPYRFTYCERCGTVIHDGPSEFVKSYRFM